MKSHFKKLGLSTPFLFLCLLTLASLVSIPALADGAQPPALTDSILALFNAIKDHAAAAVILYAVFQVLKTNETIGILGKLGLQGKGMQIAVAVITALGYVFNAYIKEGSTANWFQAAVEGLFTSGGAMLIYSAISAHAADATAPAPAPVVAASAVVPKS